MHLVINTDDAGELVRQFEETMKKGQQAMLTFWMDRDMYCLSVDTPSDADDFTALSRGVEAAASEAPADRAQSAHQGAG